VNAKKYKIYLHLLLVIITTQTAFADSARDSTSQGNKLYEQGNFNEAINKYDEALVEAPEALEPKFNKANSYYKLDDLGKAIDLYRQVAAESKDMDLVAKSKYNLGNSYFQQGSKQRDSNLQKAIEDMKTAIGSWRDVLDIEPENEKAAKNIEVARLTIKDMLDQLKNQQQQQDPNQPQNPNQQQDSNQQQQGSQEDPNQNEEQQKQQDAGQEPNQPQDPNKTQEQQQQKQQQEQQENKEQQQLAAPDTTAQEILDEEQRRRKERQILQRGGWQKVEKDW
jgi:Ca-activated chloride channel family protein